MPDGRVKWIRDHAFPVRDAEGRVFRKAGIATEVTAQKRLEAELIAGAENGERGAAGRRRRP